MPGSSACTIEATLTSSTAGTTNFPLAELFANGNTVTPADTTTVSSLSVNTDQPTLTQSFSPSTVAVGAQSTLTYTFDYGNVSGTTSGGFDISDTLPDNLVIETPVNGVQTCTGASGSLDFSVVADTGTNTISITSTQLAFGPNPQPSVVSPFVCTVTVPVRGAVGGSDVNAIETSNYQNVLSFGANGFPQFATLSTCAAAITVTPAPAGLPQLTKAFSPNPVDGSGTVDVSFVVTNTVRESALNDIAFTDTLRDTGLPDLTFVSEVSDTCGVTAGTATEPQVAYSGGTIPAGTNTCTVVARYSYDALTLPQGSFAYPVAAVTGAVEGTPVTGNAASATLAVPAGTPPTFGLRFVDATTGGSVVTDASAGDTLFAEFTLTNTSGVSLSGGTFSMDFGPVPGLSTASPSGSFCNGSGTAIADPSFGNIEFNGLALSGAGSCTFFVQLDIDAGAPGGTVALQSSGLNAQLGGSIVSAGAVGGSFTVASGLDLTGAVIFDNALATTGTGTATVSLTADAENGATLTDIGYALDMGADFAAASTSVASTSCGGTATAAGNVITVAGGSLAAAATCDVVVNLTVDPGASAGTTTTFTTSTIGANPGSLSFPGVSGAFTTPAELAFSLEFIDGPLFPAGTITGRYTIDNSSLGAASNIFFTQSISSAISGMTATSLPATPCGAGSSVSGTSFLIFTGGNVEAASSCTFDVIFQAPVTLPAGDTVSTTTSNLSATFGGGSVALPPATASIPIESEALLVTKSFGATGATAGSTVPMTISLAPTTSTTIANVALTDDFDAFVTGATLDNVATNTCGGSVSGPGVSTLSLSGITLTGGASCAVTVNIAIPAATPPGLYTNTTSSVTGTVGAGTVTAQAATASVTVVSPTASATLAKVFNPSTVNAGGTTTVTYTVDNPAGGATLVRLGLTDPIGTDIPGATLSGISGNCGAGSTISGTSTLSLASGVLSPGDSCTFSATVAVPVLAPGTLTSTSSVLSDAGVTVAQAQAASLTVVSPPPDVTVATSASTIVAGTDLGVTYTIDNSSSAVAVSNLSFSLPFGAFLPGPGGTATNTCGGAFVPTPTGATLVGGTVPAGGSCALSADLTSITLGVQSLPAPTVGATEFPGITNAATFSVTVVTPPPPPVALTLAPATIEQGTTSTATLTIANATGAIPATALDISNTLPSGLLIATPSGAATTCTGGTLTAIAGYGTIGYSGGTVPALTNCTISFDVLGDASGSFTNTTGSLTSSFGNSGTASAALTVTPPPTVTGSISLTPGSVAQGVPSTYTLQITSAAAALDSINVSAGQTLPANLVVADTTNATTTCVGATISAAAGSGTISLAGGTLAAAATCSASVDVVSVVAGSYPVTLSALASDFGVQSSLPGSTLTVTPAPPVTVTAAFVPATLAQGGVTTLTTTLDNTGAAVGTTLVSFDDPLPTGLVPAAPDNAQTTCGGTIGVTATGLQVVGGSIAAGGTCTISLDVTSATAGTFNNAAETVTTRTGALTNVGASAATFTPAPAPTSSLAVAPSTIVQGAVSTVTVRFDNAGALVAADSVTNAVVFPAGVILATPSNEASTCATPTFVSGPSGVTVGSGSLPAGANCIASFDVQALSAGAQTLTNSGTVSSLGNGAGTGVALNVTAADAPTFTKVFAPSSVELGGESRMTLSVDNSGALVPAEGGAVTDTFPTGLELAADPNLVASCTSGASVSGGISTAADGVAVSGLIVPAGDVCSFAVNVRAVQGPSLENTTGALITSLGNSGTASATLTVTDAPQPSLSAVFEPSTVVQGGTSRLELTLTNASTLIDAAGAAVTVSLPADMVVAPVSNESLTCSAGTVTAAAGTGTVSLSSGTIQSGASCVLGVDVVTTSLAASQTATTGVLVTDIGTSAAGANAVLTLTPAPLPGLTKVFAPAALLQGEVSTLTYTVDNTAALVTAEGLTLGESFSGGPALADPPNFGGTCGGTPSGGAEDSGFALTGGTVAPGASCSVTVDIASPDAGTFATVSDDLVTSLGNSGTAAATLTVGATPTPVLTVDFDQTSVAQGGAATLTYMLSNSAAVAAETISFANTLPDGMRGDAGGTPSNTCGGTFSSTAQGPDVSLSGGSVGAGGSCIITLPVIATTAGNNAYAVAFSTSLGETAEASDSLVVSAAPVPVISASFTPDTVVEGGVTSFEVTFDNSGSLVDAEDLSIALETGALLSVAPTPNASSTCTNPVITLTPGDDDVSLTADAIPAAGSCTLSFDVRALGDGPELQGAGLISTSLGSSVTAAASLTITPAGAPLFSGALAPAAITQGNISTLTYTIDNSANLIEASGASFSASLSSTMQVAATPAAATTCAVGTVTAAAGDGTLTFAEGSVTEGTSCTVSVSVTSLDTGTFTATVGNLTTSLGTSTASAVTLSVGAAPAPGFRQEFTPPVIGQGQISRLELIVDNSASGLPAAQAGLSDRGVVSMAAALSFGATLPTGLALSSSPGLSNSCGGTVTADPNGGQVLLAGGAVAAGMMCTVGVNVTSITEGVAAAITGSLTSTLGGATLAAPSTPLTVTSNPFGSVTFVQNSVADATFGFVSAQPAFNFSIATSGGSGSFGPVLVSTGTYTVTQSRPSGIGNETLVCSDMNSTVDVTAGTVTLAVDLGDNITCTWGAVNAQSETVDQINTFLNRRNNLILSTGPSSARRMARLNQGVGGAETLRFRQGDLASATPFSFDLLSLGSNNYTFSTSLQQIERSRRMFRLAVDGVENNEEVWTPPRWDVWFEASYTKYEATGGSDGHFGIAYLGADYLVSEDILAGFLLQYDSLDDGDDGGATIDGTGWMAGPYVTARIAPNLIFDGRIAYGQSSNTISPFGTYSDRFDTDRFLVDATLSGNFDWDKWVVTPNLSLSYIEDRAEGYVDGLGVSIPEQKVSLGQIRVRPTFSTTFEGRNQTVIRPSFTVNGIYNFSDTDGVTIVNDTSGETDGFRGRLQASVQISGRSGVDLTFGMHYDGIGANDFEAIGARLQLSIPLN